MISAFDRWVLRDRCAILGQSLPESELEFERQEETYQDQKAAWDACTIENNKPQTPDTCHHNPPHPKWALESVTYPMNGAAENRCSICAELDRPSPCGVPGHTMATWVEDVTLVPSQDPRLKSKRISGHCLRCAELAAPAPCGVPDHTLATWKGLTEHEPDCSCSGDSVKHGQDCANCDCDFKTAHCLRCAEVATAREGARLEAAKANCKGCEKYGPPVICQSGPWYGAYWHPEWSDGDYGCESDEIHRLRAKG